MIITSAHTRLPDNCHEDFVYSNMQGVIRQDVVDYIAHDQTFYAKHDAKGYHGCVYASVVYDSLMWFEVVYRGKTMVAVLAGEDLETLITSVIEEFGYA